MKEESQTRSVPPPLKGSLLIWSSLLKEHYWVFFSYCSPVLSSYLPQLALLCVQLRHVPFGLFWRCVYQTVNSARNPLGREIKTFKEMFGKVSQFSMDASS